MTRIILAFCMIFILAGPAAFSQESGRPKIAVKEYRHQMGTIAPGTKATYVFEISNAGTAVLVIDHVQPG